jgi:hypothetical protein
MYEIDGRRIGVRSTSAWFSAWLDQALERFRSEGEDRGAPRYSVVLGEPKQGAMSGTRVRKLHILYRGTAAIVRTRDLRTLSRALFSELGSAGLAERDDAIYLAAGAIASSMHDASALVPGYFVARLARLRRRAELAGLLLPGSTTTALDLEGRRLVPLPRLEIRRDAFELLPRDPQDGERDDRAFIDRPVKLGALLSLGPSEASGLSPMPKGLALYRWSAKVLNLGVLGGAAVETLGRLVHEVPCHQVGWRDPATWLSVLDRAMTTTPDGERRRAGILRAPR